MLKNIQTYSVRLLAFVLFALPLTSFARWYDAGTGRFLSEDPLLTDALHVQKDLSSPMALSPWLYADGNPTRYTDFDGRQASPTEALAMQCAFGGWPGYCGNPQQFSDQSLQLSEKPANISLAVSSLGIGWELLGLKGVLSAWGIGTVIDVGRQSYEDPKHFKTLDEIDFVDATLNGAKTCAIPSAIKGVGVLGVGGKVLSSSATLFLSGAGLREASSQFKQGYQQGDYSGRCVYGLAIASMAAAGAGQTYVEWNGLAQSGRQSGLLPEWLFSEIEFKWETGPATLAGSSGVPPFSVSIVRPTSGPNAKGMKLSSSNASQSLEEEETQLEPDESAHVNLEHAKDFDAARRNGFAKAGMENPEDVKFTKEDPKTGTIVEFKGPAGAKVNYDSPHAKPGPGHDSPHVGWQTGGKRTAGGRERGNITYEGPQHPYRSPIKGEGKL